MGPPLCMVRLFTPVPNPQPVDIFTLTPDLGSITYSSTVPGGFNGLTVSLSEQFLSGGGAARRWPGQALYPQVRAYGHVEAWMGSAQVWEGRGTQVNLVGAEPRGFVSSGYALTATQDVPFFSTDGTLRTAGYCLAYIFGTVCPGLRRRAGSSWVDSGVPHALAEFDGKTFNQVADQLGKEGTGTTLVDFALWEYLTASLVPRLQPAAPDYILSLDAAVTISVQGAQSYGSVIVQYGQTTGSAPSRTTLISNPLFAQQFGITRELLVQGGAATAYGAKAYAATQLAQLSSAQYSVTLKLDALRGMPIPSGGEKPAWLVRAGEWVQVGDLGTFLIIKAEYNTAQDQLTVDLGVPPPIYEELIREQVRRTGNFVVGTNPNTGA